ncbi:MAG TPA: SRPBCC domain-containing protein [Gemmatimonadales bacterium]|nr:SRPBCC domain-containing protein [Gemmatimonadales bacterium]
MTERTKTPKTRSAEGEITIDATPERIWQAMTDEREMVRWFPLDAKVEPGPNGSVYLSWLNEFAETAEIQVWDPPHHLRTAWSFHPEGPTQITDYYIEARGGRTVVRAVTSGFPLDQSWDDWVEGTNRGWAFELRSLKHYLERHPGEPRHVVYLRRRIPISNDEAWSRLLSEHELSPWLASGDVFDHRPAAQLAAIVDDPKDALFRVSVEPGGPGTGQREIVLWLSAWGDHKQRVEELRTRWVEVLERLFPEGEAA